MKYTLITFFVLAMFSGGYLNVIASSHDQSFTTPTQSNQTFTNQGNSDEIFTTPSDSNSAVLANPLDSSISSIPAFFRVLIEIILVFAIPFIVFFIIYAGFLYVTAQGNPESIKKAHNALLYALIGGMLILGANVLLVIITNTVDQIK